MNLDVQIQMAASSLFRSLFNKLSPKRPKNVMESASQSPAAPVPAHLVPSGKPMLRIVRKSDQHSGRSDH